MNYQEIYFQQLEKACKGKLKNFKEDLQVHDKKSLTRIQTDFLYGIRATGTDLIKLPTSKQDIEAYFTPKFLYELLQKKHIEERYNLYKNGVLLWLDYEGRNTHFFHASKGKLKKISLEKMYKIAYKYFVHVHNYLNNANALEIEKAYEMALKNHKGLFI